MTRRWLGLVCALGLVVAACGAPDTVATSSVEEPEATTAGSPASTASTTETEAPTTEAVVPATEVVVPDTLPFERDLATGWVPLLDEGEGFGVGGGSMFRLALTDLGAVAVGFTCESVEDGSSTDCYPAAWVSADGLDWDKVYGPEAGLGAGFIRSVTTGGSGVVAVGSTCNFFSPRPWNCLPAVWTSADGRDWTYQPQPEGTFEACLEPDTCHLGDVGSIGEMLVASGVDSAGHGVWTSLDGEEWTKVSLDHEPLVPTDDDEGDLVPVDIATFHLLASGSGVIALGNVTVLEYDGARFVPELQPTAVWTSPGGKTWERVEDADELLNRIEARLAAEGSEIWPRTHVLAMWMPSPDEDTWSVGSHSSSQWSDLIAFDGRLIALEAGEQIKVWTP